MAEGRAPQFLDVREAWERALGTIEPSAHAPLSALERGEALPAGLSKTAPTVVFCAVGARSLRALPLLRAHHGFQSVMSLRGGFREWEALR